MSSLMNKCYRIYIACILFINEKNFRYVTFETPCINNLDILFLQGFKKNLLIQTTVTAMHYRHDKNA